MGVRTQSITREELDSIFNQCSALHQDWQRFYQLATQANSAPDSQRDLALIQLQSRLSCDYPILSNARRDRFGLASRIAKLVANSGTMAAFALEASKGSGPLLQEWTSVNDAINRVCGLLDTARAEVRAGKTPKIPRELAPIVNREPFPIQAVMRKVAIAFAVVCGCVLFGLILKPYLVKTGFFVWLDKSYTAWQLRNGLPGAPNPNELPPH